MKKPTLMSYKIAIVEDELPIQSMYRLKLEREGFEVAVASNGRTGLALTRRRAAPGSADALSP